MGERLVGKVALVTGSTAGCGEATAIRFAAEGAKVMVTGRNREARAEVVEEIRPRGARSTFTPPTSASSRRSRRWWPKLSPLLRLHI